MIDCDWLWLSMVDYDWLWLIMLWLIMLWLIMIDYDWLCLIIIERKLSTIKNNSKNIFFLFLLLFVLFLFSFLFSFSIFSPVYTYFNDIHFLIPNTLFYFLHLFPPFSSFYSFLRNFFSVFVFSFSFVSSHILLLHFLTYVKLF